MSDLTDEIKKELEQLSVKLEQAKTRSATLKGSINTEERQLKREFGCDSLVEGKSMVEQLKTDEMKLEEEIDKKYQELKEGYSW